MVNVGVDPIVLLNLPHELDTPVQNSITTPPL